MKKVKFQKVRAIAAILLASLFAVFGTTVFAEDIDLDAKGSISVTFTDSASGKAVADGVLSMYRVADIISGENDSFAYAYTSDFAACKVELGDLTGENLPQSLSAYTQEKKLTAAATQSANKDGICKFDELEPGLYLIVQTKAAQGYYAVSPFLVSVPMSDKTGWVYDVDATPKMETLKETTTTTTTTTTTITTTTITTTTTTVTTTATTTTGYNSNVNGANGSLAQTGQLNWPVPVLAGAGLILFLAGWSAVFTDKKSNKKERR